MLVIQYEGEYQKIIQLKTDYLTSLLPNVFDWIKETMNGGDEVWRLVHQKCRMSLIIKNLNSIEKQLLIPWCYQWCLVKSKKSLNESDELWRLVHQKYRMSWIVWNWYSVKKQRFLPFCYWWCSIESPKKWMRVMQYEVERIKNMEWVDSYNIILGGNKCSYLTVTGDVIYNQQNNEL